MRVWRETGGIERTVKTAKKEGVEIKSLGREDNKNDWQVSVTNRKWNTERGEPCGEVVLMKICRDGQAGLV